MPRDLILGTAGHLDHGKTSLVRTLARADGLLGGSFSTA
jgi:translation elongation factor EF-Tu-like GTPase